MAAPRGTLLPHGSTLHSAFQSQILARRPRCRGNHRTLGARHGPASLLTCPPNAAPAVHHRQQLILPPLSRSTGDFYRPVSATLTNRQCPHVRNATVGTGPVAQETRPLPRRRSLGAAPVPLSHPALGWCPARARTPHAEAHQPRTRRLAASRATQLSRAGAAPSRTRSPPACSPPQESFPQS
jgi:hypothetical protein